MNVIVTQKPAPLPRNYSKQLRDLTMLLLSKNPAGRPDVHKVGVGWVKCVLFCFVLFCFWGLLLTSLLHSLPTPNPFRAQVLSLPWISSRIQKFLGAPLIKDEFSHTVLHNNGRRSVPQRPPGMTIAESGECRREAEG